MKTLVIVQNRVEHDTLSSDLCYPDLVSDDRKLGRKLVIDPLYVRSILRAHYAVLYIANKYVVNVDNMLWYQHDNQTWLLETVNT